MYFSLKSFVTYDGKLPLKPFNSNTLATKWFSNHALYTKTPICWTLSNWFSPQYLSLAGFENWYFTLKYGC